MTTWQDELKKAITDVLLREGQPVQMTGDGYYGWLARDWESVYAHMNGCQPDYGKCSWEDTEWVEFASTRDGSRDMTGVQLTYTCQCGELSGRKFRYTGGYAELMNNILTVGGGKS